MSVLSVLFAAPPNSFSYADGYHLHTGSSHNIQGMAMFISPHLLGSLCHIQNHNSSYSLTYVAKFLNKQLYNLFIK